MLRACLRSSGERKTDIRILFLVLFENNGLLLNADGTFKDLRKVLLWQLDDPWSTAILNDIGTII